MIKQRLASPASTWEVAAIRPLEPSRDIHL
jgi:hypothetical protein